MNTVSKTFLHEIIDGKFPKIIPESVRHTVRNKCQAGWACGILNAPNDSVDPRLSQHITPYYIDDFPEKKAENKLAFVANGDPTLQRQIKTLLKDYKGRIAYQPFSESMSELGKAASDFMLMPSQYEPCGLPQMECPRFGTLPVARLTGGISDTVTALDPSQTLLISTHCPTTSEIRTFDASCKRASSSSASRTPRKSTSTSTKS